MSKHVMILAAILAAAACSAAAYPNQSAAVAASELASAAPMGNQQSAKAELTQAFAAREDANLRCDLRATRTSHGVAIDALAFSDRPVSGSFDLVVHKNGAAGGSDINQSGEFSIGADGSANLGSSEISVERGARLNGHLILRDAGGAELCRSDL